MISGHASTSAVIDGTVADERNAAVPTPTGKQIANRAAGGFDAGKERIVGVTVDRLQVVRVLREPAWFEDGGLCRHALDFAGDIANLVEEMHAEIEADAAGLQAIMPPRRFGHDPIRADHAAT